MAKLNETKMVLEKKARALKFDIENNEKQSEDAGDLGSTQENELDSGFSLLQDCDRVTAGADMPLKVRKVQVSEELITSPKSKKGIFDICENYESITRSSIPS